ncbi:hypothetical protein HK096_003255 [Nowakowskiella sp. JEL0078]|nr:hypothetical protein HK096_003255 [Nowakowskiella sp. JEL0078]
MEENFLFIKRINKNVLAENIDEQRLTNELKEFDSAHRHTFKRTFPKFLDFQQPLLFRSIGARENDRSRGYQPEFCTFRSDEWNGSE